MNFSVNLFTAIIVLIVGIYDISYAYNRRLQPSRRGVIIAFGILGVIFTIGGIVMIIMNLVQ